MRFNKTYKTCLVLSILLGISRLAFSEEYLGEYLIKVSFSQARLTLFEGENKLKEFPVALPRVTPQLPIRGKVLRIEKDPFWFPTLETRRFYSKKRKVDLPLVVKPGDPKNAMGRAKIIIKFETPDTDPRIRIHGTNDRDSIGQRVSRGCIRMYNEDILELISITENKTTMVLFVVDQ